MNATLLALVSYTPPSTQFRYSTLDLSLPPTLTSLGIPTGTGYFGFHPPPLPLSYTLTPALPGPGSVSSPWYMQGSTPGVWYGVSFTVPASDIGCGLTGWGCTDWWLSQYAPYNPLDPGSTVVWEWVSFLQAGARTSPTLLLGTPMVLLPAATPGSTGGVGVRAFTPAVSTSNSSLPSSGAVAWPSSPTILPWVTAANAPLPLTTPAASPAGWGRVSSLWEAGSPSHLGLLVNKVCFIEGGGGVPTSPFIIDSRSKYGVLPPTLATPPKVTLLTPYFSTCQGGYVVGALVPTLPLQVVQVQVTLTGGSYGTLDVCKWQALPLHATQGLLTPQTLAGAPPLGVGLTWPVAQFPAPTFPVYAPSQPGLVSGVVYGEGSTGIDLDVLDGGGVVVVTVVMVAKEGVVGGGVSPLRLAFSSTLQTLFNGTPGDQLTQLDTGTGFLAALNGVPLPPFTCPGGDGGGGGSADPVASCFAIHSTTDSFTVGTPASLAITLTASPGTGFINQAIQGSPFTLPVDRVAGIWSGCAGALGVWSTTTTSSSNPSPIITLQRGTKATLRVDIAYPTTATATSTSSGCGTLTALPMQYFWLELQPTLPTTSTSSFLTLFNVLPRGVTFLPAPLPPSTSTSIPLLALFVTFTPQHTGNLTLCLHAMGTTLGCVTPSTLQGEVSPLNSTLHSTLGWLPSDPLGGWDTPTEARVSITAGRVGSVTIDWRDASGSLVVWNQGGEDAGSNCTTRVSLVVFNATPILGVLYDTNPWGHKQQQQYLPTPCTVFPTSITPTATPTLFTYNCTASGWYTMGFTSTTVSNVTDSTTATAVPAAAFVYDPRPLQVLPGRPAFLMGTVSGPTVVVVGTCSDWHVRLRDRFGNGLVDDLPIIFVTRHRPVVWAEWVPEGGVVAVRGGMKATLEGPNATVPSPWGGYSGGGTVRVRACAFGAPPGNYTLRVVLTLQASGVEGEVVAPQPQSGSVAMVSGPPWGAGCVVTGVGVVNSTDAAGVALLPLPREGVGEGGALITVRAGEGGVATLSVWLKDRLGFNLSSGAAGALVWSGGSFPLFTASAVHTRTLQWVAGVASSHPSDPNVAVFAFPLATLTTSQGTVVFNVTIAQSLVTIPYLGASMSQPTLRVLVRTPSPTPSSLPSPSLGVGASSRTPSPESPSAASTPSTSSWGVATASGCPSGSSLGGVRGGSGTSSPSLSAVGGVGTLTTSVTFTPLALVSTFPTQSGSLSPTCSPSISVLSEPTTSSFLSPSTSVPPLYAPTLTITLTPPPSSTAPALYTASSSPPSLSSPTPTPTQTSTPVLFYNPYPTSSLPPDTPSPTFTLAVLPLYSLTPICASSSIPTTTSTSTTTAKVASVINATQVEEQLCSSGNFVAILFCKYPVESRGVASGLPLLLLLLLLLLVCCCRRKKPMEENPSPPPTPHFSPTLGTHPLFSPLHAAMILAASSSSSSSSSTTTFASSHPSPTSLSASGSAPFRATASEASESAREGVHGGTLRDTVELFRSSFTPVGAPKIGGGGGPGSGRRTEMLARLLDFTTRFADK